MKLPSFLEKLNPAKKNRGELQAMGLLDFIAPPAIKFNSDSFKIGEKIAKTYFVFSFPRYLSTGWLSPIINMDVPMDISIFLHPVETGLVLKKLRKKVTEVQSEIMEKEEKGLIRDPVLETAYKDIEVLRDRLQTAQERMFQVGIYMTIYSEDKKQLEQIEGTLRSMLESKLIYIKPALYQQEKGMMCTYPAGIDQLQVHTSINTSPLSTVFPFVSFDLSSNEGILYGINQHNSSLVLFDRFSLENANSVVFGKSGGGKSLQQDELTLVKENGKTKLEKIGKIVERQIKKYGCEKIDQDLEGAVNPSLQVWSFDKNMKSQWSNVSVAARKVAPATFYKFKTKSGREITTTGDHNMLILDKTEIKAQKSSEIKTGDYVPLTRKTTFDENSKQSINLLEFLAGSKKIYILNAQKLIEKNYKKIKKELPSPYLYKYKQGTRIPLDYFLKIFELLRISTDAPQLKNIFLTSRNGKTKLRRNFVISPALMRILGAIVSEGTIQKRIIIISNKEEKFLKSVENDFQKMEIPCYRTKDSINCGCRLFIEIIKKLELKGKSQNKRAPALVFSQSKENIAAFLSSYFEGDGGVEDNKISAVSKSKQLISEISYLLYYFGIVARIQKKKKKATNYKWKRSRTYWQITISGKDHLSKFKEEIDFLFQRKKDKLNQIIKEKGNTNIDIVPGLASLFKEIYNTCPVIFRGIEEISPIKRGIYNPSPSNLKKIILKIEKRISILKRMSEEINLLSELPELQNLIEIGKNNKNLNRILWSKLGQSWRLMKNEEVNPGLKNVGQTIETIYGKKYNWLELKEIIHNNFKELAIPIKNYNRSLQTALVDRVESDTRYSLIYKSVKLLTKQYQNILQEKIPQVEKKLEKIKILANSDLCFDEIVEIIEIKNKKDKYVYDLTVDNEVFMAGTGGMFVHNSYAIKLEILRSLMLGVESIIVDPENEYKFLADAVGEKFYNITLASDSHINPFDLPEPTEDEEPEDVLRSNIINLVGLMRIMLGGLSAEEDALIDQAIAETYAARDITGDTDPSLWPERVPLLSDLEAVLETMDGAESMVKRLRKFTKGVYAGFFNYHTNVIMDNKLVVFGIKNLEAELKPLAMFIIMRYIWNTVKLELKKRILVIDEAWWLMQTEDSASFLYGIVKRGRKYWLGTTTITQDVNDFMKSEYGQPIITNSSLQLLMKQSPATIEILKETFNLTDQEKYLLLQAPIGEGIFFAGEKHVSIRVVASYTEDQIVTTDPGEVAKIKKIQKLKQNE